MDLAIFIDDFLHSSNITYETQVDLKKKTWIHRGGVASYFIKPSSVDELEAVCSFCYGHHLCFEIVGATSNLYFLNSYNPDIVISTLNVKNIEENTDVIICDCGVNVRFLAKKMIDSSVKGFEGIVDLPGTVGASVYNNSTAFGCGISQMLLKIELLTEDGMTVFLSAENLAFSERSSALKRGEIRGVVLRVFIKKEYGSMQELKAVAEKNHQTREMNQDGYANNLGSCFVHIYYNSFIFLILRIMLFPYKIAAKLLRYDNRKYNQTRRNFLCCVMGYRSIVPYISQKNMNTFVWKDDGADYAFIKYVEWMRKVFKADPLEIEIKSGKVQ